MKIIIDICTDNAAFGEDDYSVQDECARIGKAVLAQFACGYREGQCIDSTGVCVGQW